MKYDINDPTDLDIMRNDYEWISEEEWQEYLDFAYAPENKRSITFDERACLSRMKKQAGQARKHSDKDIHWGLIIVEKIERLMKTAEDSAETEEALEHDKLKLKRQHVTFRVAWHDNKWNGHICNNPENNRYCSGFNSLLSERLRKRKAKNFESELKYRGQLVNEDYLPPCFWGINIFGSNDIPVQHDNPADPNLELINEKLPTQSLFSWPFAVSFSRTADQFKMDGAYPKNLESVRIPRFQSKIKASQSVAFIYTKFSNPLTEEEQQYLVVGCGLVTEKGKYTYFGPQEVIDKKRNGRNTKYRNFPSMNWSLRYSFQQPELLVRLPYHEYLEYVNQPNFDEESRQMYLDKIKVAITEPELNHCFKYVAMDVDDDEAIYILSKIRKQLIDCKDDGIVAPSEMVKKIEAVEELLSYCWEKRTYFPGFSPISREILNWDKPDFPLDELIDQLQQNEGDDYHEKFIDLLSNPGYDATYKQYKALLNDLKEKFEDNYGLTQDQFLGLCMLNLKPFQYKRILSGKMKLSGDWKKTIDDEHSSHKIDAICDNPYILFENYVAYEQMLDSVTGEEMDSPIDLFKIDIAYFPDSRCGVDRIDLQRVMRNNDKRRLRALTIRYLRTLENTGHCFVDAEELEAAIKAYPLFYNMGTDYQLPARFFETLKPDYIIHFEEDETKIKVVSENDTNYFYLYEVYNAEAFIEKVVEQLITENPLNDSYKGFQHYLSTSCTKLREKLGTNFDEVLFRDERTRLYENIFNSRFYVLAGNPGSGKSYELLKIITLWKEKGEKCLLLAPTGKAALRLKTDKDFDNIDAYTIDKIMADVLNGKTSRSAIRAYQNIIIDEMSMVDLLKLRDLLKLISIDEPSFKRLIFVGDPNQLPAIGYGKVLRDVLYFLKSHTEHNDKCIELQTNCRQELAESKILEFSEGFVTDGEISSELKEIISSGQTDISKGFRLHFWSNEEELYQKINMEFDYLCQHLTKPIQGTSDEKLNQLFCLDKDGLIPKDTDFDPEFYQILSPYRSDFFGTSQLNDFIQTNYKSDYDLELMQDLFKQSDKIIRTKNYYERGKLVLSNGSIGFIRDNEKGDTMLYFSELDNPMPLKGEEGKRAIDTDFFDLAYAITVHKAQGSGFNHCFFVIPRKLGLLSKELIYTALTRSRESITIFVQGSCDEAFEKSVLEKAKIRSYTESRKTTLLLDKPFRYYSLEADGKFIASRVELLIYQALKDAQKHNEELKFEYEVPPTVNGKELPMKTDFTVLTSKGIWYWEHLGKLGNKNYEWTWHNVKRPSYKQYGVEVRLITTHERNGINPDKIKEIIELIFSDELTTEDKTNRYSLHHYSLR